MTRDVFLQQSPFRTIACYYCLDEQGQGHVCCYLTFNILPLLKHSFHELFF
ncbi:hypothetical protein BFAG_01290 [Bacteroides fragilis 3_1_12]|uniref:Uncharacterized protein n=1 Tax=Bacteroides fragilis 3_1_12 TaxID=457424 RepID=A0ABN0BI36_BACFG|nr:hypothetical protein BFAG_01290 [Bacteroides fragilis 3_1_12]